MPPNAKASFVLFDVGHDEHMLRLGDLVLYNYNDPLSVRHYTCKQVPARDETAVTTMANLLISRETGPRTGMSLQTAGFIKLGTSLNNEDEIILVADSAQRVVLRSPRDYLMNVVLTDELAREALTLWLSASMTDHIRKFRWARKPKVWMMTGLYLLERTKVVRVKRRSIGAEVGISSELVAALTATPVGGSINASTTASMTVSMEVPERMVWAAQYQLLETKYLGSTSPAASIGISVIKLHPDFTVSSGQLRSSTPESRTVEILGLEDVNDSIDASTKDDEEAKDGSEKVFTDAIEEVIRTYEGALKEDNSTDEG